jgi:hypothetical protein
LAAPELLDRHWIPGEAKDLVALYDLRLDKRSLRSFSGRLQATLAACRMELQEGAAIMQTTPWVVVEADDKQTIQREFSQGEIVDKFQSKDHAVFLVQSPKLPPLPTTVLQGPIYGVGIFRDERRARTLAKRLAEI